MTRRTVVVTRHSRAPAESAWDLVSRAAAWREWTPIRRARLEREGVPVPDGVGAIRNFGGGFITAREEVVAFEPPTHLGYRMLSGLPLRDYRSDVTLTRTAEGGTDITWRSTFETPKPATGWFWYRFIGVVLRTLSARLARAAERRTG